MVTLPDSISLTEDFQKLPVPGTTGKTVNITLLTDSLSCQQEGYRYGKGVARAIAKPKTTEDVQAILYYCHTHHICIVPQGGNTGLVGASVPDDTKEMLLLSTSLLDNKRIKLNKEQMTVTASAGVILQVLNDTIAEQGVMLPIDIGAKESCQIGGLLATNAAGTRAGRYGNVKEQLVAYTVALPDGTLEHHECSKSTHPHRVQDNSMIDTSQPFIGSGGAFGVIVEATFNVVPTPIASETALLVPHSYKDISAILAFLSKQLGDQLTAFESMDDACMRLTAEHLKAPYLLSYETELNAHIAAGETPIGLLVEISSTTEDNEHLQNILWQENGIIEQLAVRNLIIAAPQIPSQELWHTRHHISDAIRRRAMTGTTEKTVDSLIISHDISVAKDLLGEFEVQARTMLHEKYGQNVEVYAFGHRMIDAVHFNIIWNPQAPNTLTDKIKHSIRHDILALATREPFNGSVSAEHGLGPHTAEEIQEFCLNSPKGKAYVKQVEQLKERYDPHCIMNPMVDGALGIQTFAAKKREML